ncbi:type I-C CRISPR-associated protein Cas8c/Csd1 [Heliophilum fasciatum]|uniref:CRISPR-associated protein Csd1 n=1 Tax=Heliophilum fasciatum TaxID=35700 RepID=A0A4R2RPG9_9FIRM|nr:type I-C CRISPR-associated protein Cas8c/Csd1 [Heliophilum fasciatum]MCW2279031.1 CRISPR-associated protein Csd1 [Heliophilum fasciatum]TCP61731.1 CRISPR-associated protein Csd1 [Heliophilum fasciatum]
MLIQRLTEYAETAGIPPTGYREGILHWWLDLDMEGNLLSPEPIPLVTEEKKKKGKMIVQPSVGNRTVGIVPNLLADKAEYVLGMPKAKPDPKTEQRHRSFVELVRDCAKVTEAKQVQAVLLFLERFQWGDSSFQPTGMTESDIVAFRVNGDIVTDLEAVRAYWADKYWQRMLEEDEAKPKSSRNNKAEAKPKNERSNELVECMVCGCRCSPVPRHPYKLPRIPGGQTSGNALISANNNAFESYGLEASLIAPMCATCVEKYGKAAIQLIQSDENSLAVGPLRYIFWTKEPVEFSFVHCLTQPDPKEVKALLLSAKKGSKFDVQDKNAFYAAALSASGARVVLRNWIECPVQEVSQNLARWFELQDLVGTDGQPGEPMGLYTLASSLYRDKKDAQKSMVAQVPQSMLRVAMSGGPLPTWLLYQAVKRNRAHDGLDSLFTLRARTALIKAVLLSQPGRKEREGIMASLDPNSRDTAYRCGRLLALLESIQEQAVSARATVIDRYFGAASSSPSTVFPMLLRGAQNHLGKMRKIEKKKAAYKALQEKMETVLVGLEKFPKVLTLDEQGLFSLGYYHQRAEDRASMHKHIEAKNAKNEKNNGGKE